MLAYLRDGKYLEVEFELEGLRTYHDSFLFWVIAFMILIFMLIVLFY